MTLFLNGVAAVGGDQDQRVALLEFQGKLYVVVHCSCVQSCAWRRCAALCHAVMAAWRWICCPVACQPAHLPVAAGCGVRDAAATAHAAAQFMAATRGAAPARCECALSASNRWPRRHATLPQVVFRDEHEGSFFNNYYDKAYQAASQLSNEEEEDCICLACQVRGVG